MQGSIALFIPIFASAATPTQVPDAPPVSLAMEDIINLGLDGPGRMTVPVTIDRIGPYRFTIDTGAERTVISRQLAERLGLARGRDVRVTAITGASSRSTAIIPSIAVSSAGGTRIEAPLFEASHLGAPGLIGIDALKGHAVSIDFETREMTIRPSTRANRPRVRTDEIVVRAKSLLGQLVVTDASYRDRRVRVILDTGSAVSLGNLALKRRAGIGKSGTNPIAVMSVTGDSLSADYTHINNVTIGTAIFPQLPIAFSDAPPFERLGLRDQPALLLGMDALRMFRRVEIDFANREVRLSLPRNSRAAG